MTQEKLMYHWLQEAERYEREVKFSGGETTCEIKVKIELSKQARLFYMMLSQMETEAPKVETSTKLPNDYVVSTFTKPCNHDFDITGIYGFRCIHCGIHPSEVVINSNTSQP